MEIKLKILYLEDSPQDADILSSLLCDAGFEMELILAASKKEYEMLIYAHRYDIILSDYNLLDYSAKESLKLRNQVCPEVPFICVSGAIGEEVGIELLKQGANDYILKDRLSKLPTAIIRAIEEENEKKLLQQAQEKLKQASEHWSKTFDAMHDGIFLLDQDRKILECNSSFLDFVGKKHQDEVIGLACWELLDNSLCDEDKCPFISVQKNGKRETSELKSGKCDYAVTVDPLFDAENNMVGAVHIISDITQRKNVEQLMRESEIKYSAVFQASPSAVSITTKEGVYVDINKGFTNMSGYSRDEVIGFSASQIEFWAHASEKEAMIEHIVKNGNINGYEMDFLRKDGSVGACLVSVSNIILNDHSYFLNIAHDVTELKKATEKIKESEQRLIQAQNIARLGSFVFDLESRQWSGYDMMDELLGIDDSYERTLEGWIALTHPDDRAIITDYITDFVKGKNHIFDKEHRIIRHNDKVVCWLWSKVTMERDADGHPLKLRGISMDITEIKNAEELLREKELQYRNLANSGLALIWSSGADKLCNYFNDIWLQFTGRTMEQEMGKRWTEGIHPDDYDHCLKVYVEAFDNQQPFEMEYRLHHVSGDYRWIQDMGTPNYNSNKEFIGYIGYCFDITERKLAEEELKQLTSRLSLATRAGGVGVWDLDVVSNTLIWDEQMFVLYGIKCDDFSGAYEAWQAGLHPEDIERAHAEVKMAITDKKEFDTEFRVVWPDGTIRHIKALANIQRDDSGQALHMIGTNWDITERKHAEEELKNLSTRLFMATHGSGIGVWDFDIVTNALVWDEQMFALYGIKEADFSGAYDAWQTGLHKEDLVRGDAEIQMAITAKKDFDTEFRVVWPNGAIRHIKAIASVQRDESGQPLRMIGTNWDITESKLAEEKSRKLSTAMEQSSASIVITDLKGIIEYVNPAFTEKTGYSYDEVVGRNPSILKSGITTDKEYADLWKTISAGGVWHGEFGNKKKNGEIFWEYASISPILNESGEATHYLAVKDDVTQRKQIEKELLASEQKYRNIFENVQDVFYQIDLNGIILEISPSIKYFPEFEGEALVGDSVFDLFKNRADRDLFLSELNKKGELNDYELQLKSKSGKVKYVSVNARLVIDAEGKPHHVNGSIRDMTARKEAEMIKQKQVEDMVRFGRIAVNRENRMQELKKEINDLLEEQGKLAKYEIFD
jgi:PAS domain S-box-containing protein